MARSVLLIEPDVDELGVLASKLRSRGLEVWIADSVESALARVRKDLPDAVLISEALGPEDALSWEAPVLSGLPLFRLVSAPPPAGDPSALARGDAEGIARRILALPRRVASIAPSGSDFRGDLAQVPVVDLVQLLSINRRSGALTLQTSVGTGEIRFVEGEVVDALYRRLEGKKALYRLLAEPDGSFSFVGGGANASLRRIHEPSHVLLMDGIREIDEVRDLRGELALGEDALIATRGADPQSSDVDAMVLDMLATPHTLTELVDDVPALDLEVMRAAARLLDDGSLRRIPGGTRRVELADPDRLGVLAALSKRIARPGFREAGRVAFAASPRRLLDVMASLGRIAEAVMPSEALPAAPIPHVLSTLRLGDAVELELIGIPLVDSYAPLWSLVLPGCSALALIEEWPRATLENACETCGVPLLDASRMVGPTEAADPEMVALLVQRVLESAAGA